MPPLAPPSGPSVDPPDVATTEAAAAPRTAGERGEITVLQAGRALAALVVVVHHATLVVPVFASNANAMPRTLWRTLDLGYLGVDFFFVLSGFIIAHANEGRTEQPSWSRRYLESRALRIYLPYLPIGIGVALLYVAIPSLKAGLRSWSWFSSITLLPTNHDPALPVAWTLRHELVFYAIFWLAHRIRRPNAVLAIWFVAIGATALAGMHPTGAAAFFVGPINIEFLFGILLAKAVRASGPRPALAPAAASGVGALACFAAFVALGTERTQSVIAGLGFALLLFPLVQLERLDKLRAPKSLLFLGAASYAIYLVHNPLISAVARVCRKVPALSGWMPMVVVCFVIATALGIAYHVLFERPVLAKARVWLDATRAKTVSRASRAGRRSRRRRGCRVSSRRPRGPRPAT